MKGLYINGFLANTNIKKLSSGNVKMCIIVWRERRKPFFFCFVRLVRLVRLLAACGFCPIANTYTRCVPPAHGRIHPPFSWLFVEYWFFMAIETANYQKLIRKTTLPFRKAVLWNASRNSSFANSFFFLDNFRRAQLFPPALLRLWRERAQLCAALL